MKINLNHLNGPQRKAQGEKRTESLQLDHLALNQQKQRGYLPEEQGLDPGADLRRLAKEGGEATAAGLAAQAATTEAKVEGLQHGEGG